MKPWKIFVIPTAIMLVIASIYMFTIWKKRQNPGVVGQPEQKVTMDDVAVVRRDGVLDVWHTSATSVAGGWPRFGGDNRNDGHYIG